MCWSWPRMGSYLWVRRVGAIYGWTEQRVVVHEKTHTGTKAGSMWKGHRWHWVQFFCLTIQSQLIFKITFATVNKWRCNFKSLWLRNPMKSDRSSWILLSWAIFRICVRALLLLILATARGAYVVLEQPASSVMKFMPDFVATAKLIQKHLGLWNEQFLFDTEISAILVYCICIFLSNTPFPTQHSCHGHLSELDGILGCTFG